MARVSEGASLAHQAEEAINQIKSGVQQVVDAVSEISVALKEQSQANNENSQKVERIARLSDDNSNAFQGIAIISWDDTNKHFVTRSYENHGFIRDYLTSVDGETWTFTGETERARVEFADGGDTQKIAWEWRQVGEDWLPLCDRVAKRVE